MNLSAPTGFAGLRPDLEVQVYERSLPHWRQEGATYFVTFRLADSLPKSKLYELADFRTKWIEKYGLEQKDALAIELMTRVENWLDQGMGACCLKHPHASHCVANSIQFHSGKHYQVGCYAIMPNHVHAILRPLDAKKYSLEKCLQSIKSYSAGEINSTLGISGQLWQRESFDRIVRDEEHLYRVVQYIGNNAKKAGIPISISPRWINPEWEKAGWKFDWDK